MRYVETYEEAKLCSSNLLLLVCAGTAASSSGGFTCGSCSALFGSKSDSNNRVTKDAIFWFLTQITCNE